MRLGYGESAGSPALRASIAAQYAGIDPDDVLVTCGAEEAIFLAMNVLLRPGDHVIVHTPCYQSLLELPASIGCSVSAWPAFESNGWKLDLDYLRDQLKPGTRMVILNSPHNPTGWLMDRADHAELVKLSQQHGFRIFSDEVYRFLELDPGQRLPAACEVDDRAISLGVMSKAYGLAGLRIGWTACRDRELRMRLASFKDYTTICASTLSESVARIALDHRDRFLEKSMRIVRANLEQLETFFARHPETFEWRRPGAGPIAFPGLRLEDAEPYCRRVLDEKGVLLMPGSQYGAFPRHFRIGFGRSDMKEALGRWEGEAPGGALHVPA